MYGTASDYTDDYGENPANNQSNGGVDDVRASIV